MPLLCEAALRKVTEPQMDNPCTLPTCYHPEAPPVQTHGTKHQQRMAPGNPFFSCSQKHPPCQTQRCKESNTDNFQPFNTGYLTFSIVLRLSDKGRSTLFRSSQQQLLISAVRKNILLSCQDWDNVYYKQKGHIK